jgi:hypothetical protein
MGGQEYNAKVAAVGAARRGSVRCTVAEAGCDRRAPRAVVARTTGGYAVIRATLHSLNIHRNLEVVENN